MPSDTPNLNHTVDGKGAPSILTSRLSKFNPFKKGQPDDEDLGQEVDFDSIGAGAHPSTSTAIPKNQLRVSHALRKFLVDQHVLTEQQADLDSHTMSEAVRQLLDKPHVRIPSHLTDRSHPLSEYFISSSHNTYLLAHQLYGSSSAVAYEKALLTGARCVEIDAWDSDDDRNEPKVTHGYTLASHIPFRAVCETVRDAVDREVELARKQGSIPPAPVLLSLENHCGPEGQLRLVQIMKEVWGDRLVSEPVRRHEGHAEQQGLGDPVRLDQLGSKIAVMVEYHFANEAKGDGDDDDDSSSSEDEAHQRDRQQYKQKKQAAAAVRIIPELAQLGVYAQSVKPLDDSWLDGPLTAAPPNHLINMSESGVASRIPAAGARIARHNASHLMRVFPKGTRISSRNLNPVPFWGVGAQVCALNWQTFDASMQLNAALFGGTDGYVLKPEALRAGGTDTLSHGRKRLTLHVAGASDLPVPLGRTATDIRPYLSCTLVHPHDLAHSAPKRKTAAYRRHTLHALHRGERSGPTEPVWDETLEWEYDANDLAFLRLLVKSEDAYAKNPLFAVAAVRLDWAVQREWRFVRLWDLKGRETEGSLLVRFEVAEV